MIKRLKQNLVYIQTKSSVMLVELNHIARVLYVGRIRRQLLEKITVIDKFNKHASSDVLDKNDMLFSSWSDGADLEPMLKLQNDLGMYMQRFTVKSFRIIHKDVSHFQGPHSRDKDQTLIITYVDALNHLRVEQSISTHQNSEGLVFSLKVTNISKQFYRIVKAASVQLDFPSTDNTLYTLDGTWGAERNLHQTNVQTGIFAVKSNSGYSSNIHNPFVILRNAKTFVASNLIYAGSHAESIEALPIGKSRFLSGLNDNVFSWDLHAGEHFVTPEAVITLGTSIDDVSMKMHEFVKHNILTKAHQTRKPQVLLNSWEGIFFDFNREKILNLAKQANAIGVDLFVLDDGWFGRRDDDTSSLGDWYDYQSKTGGLKSLVEQIKAIGLQFGLWFEPEMVNKNSDLYRKHPDFAMEIPGISPIERRHQLMLDFSRKEVRDYIFDLMRQVIDEVKPDYLKLDANRIMSDMYSVGLKNHGEYQHRYMLGLFEFWQKLVDRYPHILVEACSSGGNRFDLGTLFYFPQIWASDNTDALSRIYIQEGTLLGYPQSTMGTHVSHVPNTTTNRVTPLESRFNVASIGAFGYELDLTKEPASDLKIMQSQIDFYKKYSTLIFHGHYRRLCSAYDGHAYAYMISNQKQNIDEAIVFVSLLKPTDKTISIKLTGLVKKSLYQLTYRHQSNVEKDVIIEKDGEALMKMPIQLSTLYQEETNDKNDTIASRLIVLKRISS